MGNHAEGPGDSKKKEIGQIGSYIQLKKVVEDREGKAEGSN